MCKHSETSDRYNQIIKESIGSTKKKGTYTFPTTSTTIQVDPDDMEGFSKLYNANGGNQTIGFGEIALYWLFLGELAPCDHLDLAYNSSKIDIKSYGENGYLTLGKWKDNIRSRQIINSIFSCYNLINIGSSGEFKSELSFGTDQIGDALKANILLYNDISSLKNTPSSLQMVQTTLSHIYSEFKSISKDRGRKFIKSNSNNLDKIVEESISDLIYNVVDYKLFKSETGVGIDGYIANVVKHKNSPTGAIQIYKTNGLKKDSTHLRNNFSVVSGEIKIKPNILELS